MRRFLPVFIICFFLGGILWAQEEASRQRDTLRRLQESAEAGDVRAIYYLATLYDSGFDSIPVDTAESTRLYLLAAKKGYAPARNFIGFRYYKGEYLPKNIDSALYWIRLAADDGDITAAANLAYLLTESPDIPHDEAEAMKWLTIAAEAGVVEAQEKLIPHMEEEWSLLTPDSAINLGLKYYLGTAPVLGVKLFEKAATKGDPKAMALLGDAYSKGLGVPYDNQKSIDYFHQAALLGDPSAQFIITELLEFFPDILPTLSSSLDSLQPYDPSIPLDPGSERRVLSAEDAYKLLYQPVPAHVSE